MKKVLCKRTPSRGETLVVLRIDGQVRERAVAVEDWDEENRVVKVRGEYIGDIFTLTWPHSRVFVERAVPDEEDGAL